MARPAAGPASAEPASAAVAAEPEATSDAPAGAAADAATDVALRALAEPRRRAILRLVAHDELCAGEIAAAFDVTRTAVSQHLTVLRNAGLITERRIATRRMYRARPEGLDGLRRFLDDMWASSLDIARRLAEAERGITDDTSMEAG